VSPVEIFPPVARDQPLGERRVISQLWVDPAAEHVEGRVIVVIVVVPVTLTTPLDGAMVAAEANDVTASERMGGYPHPPTVVLVPTMNLPASGVPTMLMPLNSDADVAKLAVPVRFPVTFS
jgi:hypothetical protein